MTLTCLKTIRSTVPKRRGLQSVNSTKDDNAAHIVKQDGSRNVWKRR